MQKKAITKDQIAKYLTPYKYGKPVITGSGIQSSFDCNAVDSPFVFYHNGRYMMMYIGFDGAGYQTALAESQDLLHWEFVKVILERAADDRWDGINTSGNWILKESDDIHALPRLKKVNGKYWMTYHAYPEQGYEAGAASIGLAWCEEESLETWHKLEKPVLTSADGQDWEKGGLYKSCLVENNGTYFLYYNAKNNTYGSWKEQTGVAMSKDLLVWERYEGNPILRTEDEKWDSMFCSDPYVVYDKNRWLMFYFGFNGRAAQEGIAVSEDMFHFIKYDQPILSNGQPGELDEYFAHKPSVLYADQVLYHFYCASRPCREGDITSNFGREFRTITVAASQLLPMAIHTENNGKGD